VAKFRGITGCIRSAGLLLSLLAMTLPIRAQDLPPDSAYAIADKTGHLQVRGERIRFWGAIGGFPHQQETIKGDPYYRQRDGVRRAKKVGFNMFRLWGITCDDNARKGDLSATDVSDFFIAECGKQGVYLWGAGFGGGSLYEDDIEKSVSILSDPSTGREWSDAVKSMCSVQWWSNNRKAMSLLTEAIAWDSRLEALAIAQMRQKARHINLYTNRRHADDPTFAVWELTNEQWWMTRMTGGQWQSLPPYFRKSLITRWNSWLKTKYKSQAELINAWGFVFAGEDLTRETVLFAPMGRAMKAIELNDTNPAAVAAFKSVETPISREACTIARSNDVIAFLLDTIIAHKKRMGQELKSWGKSARLSPLIYDTGIGQNIQAQYMQMQADAVAHASYMEGVQLDKLPTTHKRWPFYSRLDLPMQMSNDVPWLEHNRPVNKPFLCYETQYGSPSKYRAEWPILISALGSVQDWDAACYHYWSAGNYDFKKPEPYTGALSFPGNGAYQYDYTFDEIEQATMRAASAIFKNRLADPAPHPTLFTWGRPALLDPRSMDYAGDYGGTGLSDMATTTYVNGVRIAINPDQKEFLKTEGPVTRYNGYERPSPLRPSAQIEYDYQKAHVRFDSTGVAAYTGFLGQYGADIVRFSNGVELREVKHADPPGTPFPSGQEKFTSFTLASEDGKPLSSCKKAVLALVSSSFNTGLRFTRKTDGQYDINWGKEPTLVTRVSATVVGKPLIGMRYRMIDFNERVLVEGVIGKEGILRIPSNRPIWLTELTRD